MGNGSYMRKFFEVLFDLAKFPLFIKILFEVKKSFTFTSHHYLFPPKDNCEITNQKVKVRYNLTLKNFIWHGSPYNSIKFSSFLHLYPLVLRTSNLMLSYGILLKYCTRQYNALVCCNYKATQIKILRTMAL